MEEFDSEELKANMMGMEYYCTVVLEWGLTYFSQNKDWRPASLL